MVSLYTNKQLADIKQQIESLGTQLEQVQAQIRQTSPRYASLKYPQPLTLQQIQSTVLDDDTLLLEYSLVVCHINLDGRVRRGNHGGIAPTPTCQILIDKPLECQLATLC